MVNGLYIAGFPPLLLQIMAAHASGVIVAVCQSGSDTFLFWLAFYAAALSTARSAIS